MDQYKSFLQARDPSILAWNRPHINPSIKIDLCTEFSYSSTTDEIEDECLQIYLRIKPTKDLKDLYDISNNTLVCHVPAGSQTLRNMQENSKLKKQFSFSKIYGPEINQRELFHDCIKKKVLQFINGRNCTIFTYGTSGSGKTFTIMGTSDNPGIIPRSLEYIFRTLPEVKDVPSVKPSPSGDLIKLNTSARKHELNLRQTVLNGTLIDRTQHIETYKQMQQRLSTEPAAVLGNNAVSVAIWVSFAEIYNEFVYDLLTSDPAKGKQRTKLRLAQDSKGNTYVKDLKCITVSSGLEAYEILQYGMQNLSYAATNINSHSSRSHCIFTIKLVQWTSETEVQISHFNFCDLAGSERLKNTRNVGDRLKESNNINTSLHVLGRCIESIRKSQKANDSRLIPYRDSKLTRLFQRALSGQDSLAMVVNINTTREMFDESQHVLTFSAIAREITIEKEIKPEKINVKKRFSQYLQGRSTALPVISETENNMLQEDKLQSLYFELENQQQLWAERETQIRREMLETLYKREEEIRVRWENLFETEKQRLVDSYETKIEQIQNYYEKRIAKNSKRPRTSSIIELDDSELDDDEHEKEKLQAMIKKESNLQKEITKLKFELSAQTIALDKEKESNAKLVDEIVILKEENKKLTDELKVLKQSDTRKEKIINDAKEEVEELEKEKKELETQLDEKCLEVYELQKKVTDLNEELSAHIAAKNEQTEHVEELEEKLQTLA